MAVVGEGCVRRLEMRGVKLEEENEEGSEAPLS